jgi:hypothetical protein
MQQTAAKGGQRFFFRLFTGGLLVRVQPEEPVFYLSLRKDVFYVTVRIVLSEQFFDEASAIVDAIA